MVEVLTIGEPMALFASNDMNQSLANSSSFTKYLAGAEVNVAIGINRLGHTVEYISQVGNDPLGKFIIQELKRNNILTDNIKKSDKYNTGIEFKALTDHGDPDTFYIRKNSAAAHIKSEVIDKINLSSIKLAHLTGIFPALSNDTYQTTIALIHKLQLNNIPICFDPNLRPALWPDEKTMCKTINYLSKFATIFLPGLGEAKKLTGLNNPDEIASHYFQISQILKLLILKDGSHGTYIYTRDKFIGYVPSFKVDKVIDTVGAGDGFALGLITALLEKKNLTESVKRANAIGAMAIQVHGDNTGYPTHKQLEKFFNAHPIESVSD